MATFTEAQVRARARRQTTARSAATILNESVRSASAAGKFDVFLSHSVRDAEIVLGVKLLLEDLRLTVYVDWIEDPHLDRSHVTPRTAENLRSRMRQSRSLIYIHTANSPGSKWMPWELGYSDGLHGAVAILPVTASEQRSFHGQEYLGIYPWIDRETRLSGVTDLKVHRGETRSKTWHGWQADPRDMIVKS